MSIAPEMIYKYRDYPYAPLLLNGSQERQFLAGKLEFDARCFGYFTTHETSTPIKYTTTIAIRMRIRINFLFAMLALPVLDRSSQKLIIA